MKADHDLVVEVLSRTDPLSAFVEGFADTVHFRLACEAAADAVPFTYDSFDKAIVKDRKLRERLLEALHYRDKWYRDNLPLRRVQ